MSVCACTKYQSSRLVMNLMQQPICASQPVSCLSCSVETPTYPAPLRFFCSEIGPEVTRVRIAGIFTPASTAPMISPLPEMVQILVRQTLRHTPRVEVSRVMICHVRSQEPRQRHAQDAALREPRPFARFVDRMLACDILPAVQDLRDGTGYGHQRARTVLAEIRTVGDEDRSSLPPLGAK